MTGNANGCCCLNLFVVNVGKIESKLANIAMDNVENVGEKRQAV